MSYLLEILGRGRVNEMRQIFAGHFVPLDDRALDRLRSQSSNRDHPDVQARLGVAYLQRYRLSEAIECFTRAARRKPEFLLPRLGLACCHEHQDRIEKAIEQLELANTNLPGEPSVLLALGYCHERAGAPGRAAELYNDLLSRAPQTRAARERLAAIDLAAGRFADAIGHYEWLRDDAGGGEAHVRLCLANLYLKAERGDDAVREFIAAIGLSPENWAARQQLAATLADRGQVREAIEHLLALLAQQGEFADLHVQLADLYARLGEDEQAVRHYLAALQINEDYLEAAVKLATQHLRNGRLADAAAEFNRAVQISDRALIAYVGLAVAQKNAGQWSAAMDTLELAAQLAPNSALLFREMSRLELKAALARHGETVFSAAFAGEQTPPGVDVDDDWDELLAYQIQRHRLAVRDRPSHADLHYRLGLLLVGQGDGAEAIEQFRTACQINPAYTKARVKLALALKQAGRPDEAVGQLETALDINPEYADLHYKLALLYVQQDRFGEAAEAFERSLAVNDANPEVRANLATCLESMGLLDRASAEWEKVAAGESADTALGDRARSRLDHLFGRRS